MTEQPPKIVLINDDDSTDLTLLDLVDHLLNTGIIIRGNLVLSLAGVDLVYLGLDLVVTSVETALRHMTKAGLPPRPDDPPTAARTNGPRTNAPRTNAVRHAANQWRSAIKLPCLHTASRSSKANSRSRRPAWTASRSAGSIVAALRCFFSNFRSPMADQPAPEILTAFNRVLHAIFSQTTIIPFRFPTVVENEGVLRQFLESRSSDYRAALHRLHNKVQMDVRLTLEPVPALGIARHNRAKATWSIGGPAIRRSNWPWTNSAAPPIPWPKAGCSAIPLPALAVSRSWIVPRSLFSSRRSARVLTPAGISARVTGPWPPSEFVEADA